MEEVPEETEQQLITNEMESQPLIDIPENEELESEKQKSHTLNEPKSAKNDIQQSEKSSKPISINQHLDQSIKGSDKRSLAQSVRSKNRTQLNPENNLPQAALVKNANLSQENIHLPQIKDAALSVHSR